MIGNAYRSCVAPAVLLLLAAAGCGGDGAAAPSADSGNTAAMAGSGAAGSSSGREDAGIPPREDAGSPPVAADAATPDTGSTDPELQHEDGGSTFPEPPDSELPPLAPPIILLTSSAGSCAFESLLTETMATDNPACPDGIYRGDITLRHDADFFALAGCIRVSGSVTVALEERKDLQGLESLRVIDGGLRIPAAMCTDDVCTGDNVYLESLRGLDSLRCVGGDVSVAQADVDRCGSLDLVALRMLVEVGGSLEILVCNGADADQLDSLQRVWGDLTYSVRITPDRLQIVYGASNALGPLGSFASGIHVGCRGKLITCFDGVVGCNYEAQNQAHVAALSMCEIALRDLNLSGTSITSLMPLAKLREVRGQLTIGVVGTAPASADLGRLTSLAGLESLEHIGRLAIGRQPFLTNLLPLESLASARSIRLDDMDGLLDLNGLENVAELDGPQPGDGVLWIGGNAALDTLTGLQLRRLRELHLVENPLLSSASALETLEGSLDRLALSGLPSLNSLDGLEHVTGIRELDVTRCSGLVDLAELSLSEIETIALVDAPSLSTLQGFLESEVTQLRTLHLDALPALESLVGLEDIATIGEFSVVQCDGLVDLAGLDSLLAVAERLSLANNAHLENLGGATMLAEIGTLELSRNPRLVSLAGLSALASAGLRAVDLPELTTLAPLFGVKIESLELVRLGLVTDLSGLEGVSDTLRTLQIVGNPALADLSSLVAVQSVADQLLVADNPLITSLHGLEGVRMVPSVAIANNARLEEVRALAGMTQGRVVITDNVSLPECEVDWLSERLPEPIPTAVNGPPGSCPPDG